MATRSVSEVVRHAVMLQIFLTSPALITCGGAVDGGVHTAGSNGGVEDVGSEGGVEAGGEGDVEAGEREGGLDAGREGGVEAGATCSVASLPSRASGGTCLNGVSYNFNGTMSECV